MTSKTILQIALDTEKDVVWLLKREASKESLALGKLKKDYLKRAAELKAVRDSLDELEERSVPGWLSVVPVVGARKRRGLEGERQKARNRVHQLTQLLKRLQANSKTRRTRLADYRDFAHYLHQRIVFMKRHEEYIDASLTSVVRRMQATVDHQKRTQGFRKGEVILDILEDAIPKIDAWIMDVRQRKADAVRKPTKRALPEKLSNVAAKGPPNAKANLKKSVAPQLPPRAFLPIPIDSRMAARQAGAKMDRSDKTPGSWMYVDVNSPAFSTPQIQSMLPYLFRKHGRRKFTFPVLPETSYKQNLRKLFSEETWSRTRSAAVGATGNRCVICGGRGGVLPTQYFEGEGNKRHSVECHEVWEFEVPDPDLPVGIQKLKELLVVCVDCHMMFHEDIAMSKAQRAGSDPEEVKSYLRTRIGQVNRMSPEEVDAELDQELEKAAGLADVEQWVVDLSYLAQQDVHRHQVPVILDGNDAGVSPDEIAGLAFQTEAGEFHESREPMEVYQDKSTAPRRGYGTG